MEMGARAAHPSLGQIRWHATDRDTADWGTVKSMSVVLWLCLSLGRPLGVGLMGRGASIEVYVQRGDMHLQGDVYGDVQLIFCSREAVQRQLPHR